MESLEGLDELLGAWELQSCTTTLPDGSKRYTYGSRPRGVILYSSDGWMSCHMTGGGDRDPDVEMTAYTGYFGPVVMRPDDKVVEHHVRGATVDWMLGTVQERAYRTEGDTLILAADVNDNHVEVVWKRDPDPRKTGR